MIIVACAGLSNDAGLYVLVGRYLSVTPSRPPPYSECLGLGQESSRGSTHTEDVCTIHTKKIIGEVIKKKSQSSDTIQFNQRR